MNNIMAINEFSGEYRWLSNFWPCTVMFDGHIYISSEHAYQASKTLNLGQRAHIRLNCATPGQAKRAGQLVEKREDWDEVKINNMYIINLDKYIGNPSLRKLLVATGDLHLAEGNNWGDTFWGICGLKGSNTLGKILMKIRTELS